MLGQTKRIIAAFDFDGTLTKNDILIPFFCFVFGRFPTYLRLIKIAPRMIGYFLGIQSRQDAKEIVLREFLKGMKIERMEKLASSFASSNVSLLKNEALERLQWHRDQGHTCVIVSANIDLLLKPWGKQLGVEQVISSQLEIDSSGRISGLLKGLNCREEEKVRRLVELEGVKHCYTLYVYGDSSGDYALLKIADYPFFRTFKLPNL